MLKPMTIFLHVGRMKRLAALGKSRGFRTARLVRIAIEEYLRRETRRAAKDAALGE